MTRQMFNEVDRIEVARLYWEDGLTIGMIGRKFGVSNNYVVDAFRRYGIPTRTARCTLFASVRAL